MGRKRKGDKSMGPPDTYMEADLEEASVEASNAGAVIPESALGKKMASADKKTRDKAVMVMSKWMAQQHSLNEDDHLKIWKALYYCYWMSDKPLVQQELASKLAELIHVFPSMDQSLLYFRTFFMTMLREWQGIDRLRLDKFYNLVRCFQREAFALIARLGWKPTDLTSYNNIMMGAGGVLRADCPVVGLQLHVCDIVLDELSDSMKTGLTPEGFMHIMTPYLSLLRETQDKAVFARLYRSLELLASDKWMTASAKEEEDEDEEDPLTSDKLRHYNRMFKHTYVPPIPKQTVNDICKDKAFAGSVMHALTRRIFRITISPATYEMSRRKLYELLDVCKEACEVLESPFTEDPDDVSDGEEERGGAGGKKTKKGDKKGETSTHSSAAAVLAADKTKSSAKDKKKKRPAQELDEDEDDILHDDDDEGTKSTNNKKRKSKEGGAPAASLKGKEEKPSAAKKGNKGGAAEGKRETVKEAKSAKKNILLQVAAEEAAQDVMEIKSRPGKLSVEERKKLRMSIDAIANTQGLLSSDRTVSPVRHAASAADFFTKQMMSPAAGDKGTNNKGAKKTPEGKSKAGGKKGGKGK